MLPLVLRCYLVSIADASSKNDNYLTLVLLAVGAQFNQQVWKHPRFLLVPCNAHCHVCRLQAVYLRDTLRSREGSVRKIRVVHILLQSFDFCIIGDYIWNISARRPSKGTQIDVHQHASATLDFQTEAGPPGLKQKFDWPGNGSIKLSSNVSINKVELKLRISHSASIWTVAPPYQTNYW